MRATGQAGHAVELNGAGARLARLAVALLLAPALLLAIQQGAPTAGATDASILLVGTVVTMNDAFDVVEDGRLLVEGDRIVAIWSGETPPPGVDPSRARVVDAGEDALIFPGLVNLHGHPAYNILPLWIPPSSHAQPDEGRPTGEEPYANRYQWGPRGPSEYRRLVAIPRAVVFSEFGEGAEMVKYAEAMSALGGQTTFEGAGIRFAETDFTLVRNVDHGAFCEYGAPTCDDRIDSQVATIMDEAVTDPDHYYLLGDMMMGGVDAWLVHLAEGVRDEEVPEGDPYSSEGEFDHLVELGLLTESTVLLHGNGLDTEDFLAMRMAPSVRLDGARDGLGAKLVWSPLSNLVLYGKTARIYDALRAGVLVSLGTDWTPSGSRNLLEELKIADVALRDPAILGNDRFLIPGERPTPADEIKLDAELVAMATRNPAKTIRAFDKIGSLEEGKLADVVVIGTPRASPTGGMPASPYRSLIDATERDVRLVLIDGEPVAGDVDVMAALKPGDFEVVASERGGYEKAIDVTYPHVPNGTQTLAQVREVLEHALAAFGGDNPPPEGGPADDTNTYSVLKRKLDDGDYANWTDSAFLALLKDRFGTVDGRVNIERIGLHPLLVEDDTLHFAALTDTRDARGLLDAAGAPYRVYPSNANHVHEHGNPLSEEAFVERWYAAADA